VVVAGMLSIAWTTRQGLWLGLSWSEIAMLDQHGSRQPRPRPRER
jgi:hypothetical protein